MEKAFFLLEIFTFLSCVHVLQRRALIRKLWLISKFMMSQTGQQIITIHILSNIARSEGKQTVKFGQSIEYNMRNISWKNHIQNMVKLVLDSFIKDQDWTYLWINSLKVLKFVFLVQVCSNLLRRRFWNFLSYQAVSCITKNTEQKCKYLKNENIFCNKIKSIAHNF